jgi:hypothetical protein
LLREEQESHHRNYNEDEIFQVFVHPCFQATGREDLAARASVTGKVSSFARVVNVYSGEMGDPGGFRRAMPAPLTASAAAVAVFNT